MYFNAQADAGLTRGTLAAGLGLIIWLALGTVVVKWYDREPFYRMHPDLLAHVNTAVQDYKIEHAAATLPIPRPRRRRATSRFQDTSIGLLKTLLTVSLSYRSG